MRPTLSGDVRSALLPAPEGKTVYITLGNSLRGDDRVADYIAENLQVPRGDTVVIRAGNKPEGIVDQAVRAHPAKTVLIDAVDFGGEAGTIRVFDDADLSATALSTHRFPPTVIAALLREDTGSDVRLVGVQIQQTSYGSPMGKRVKESADRIIDFLNTCFAYPRP